MGKILRVVRCIDKFTLDYLSLFGLTSPIGLRSVWRSSSVFRIETELWPACVIAVKAQRGELLHNERRIYSKHRKSISLEIGRLVTWSRASFMKTYSYED